MLSYAPLFFIELYNNCSHQAVLVVLFYNKLITDLKLILDILVGLDAIFFRFTSATPEYLIITCYDSIHDWNPLTDIILYRVENLNDTFA